MKCLASVQWENNEIKLHVGGVAPRSYELGACQVFLWSVWWVWNHPFARHKKY